MKAKLLTLALAVIHLTAFAQGKVTFGNDVNHLIMVPYPPWPPSGNLIAAPQVGTPNDVMGILTAQLWAGTSPGNLTLQSTLNPAGLAGLADGRLANAAVTLTGIAGGQTGFFQILIWETTAGSYNSAVNNPGFLSGSTPVFSSTAGGFAPTPLASMAGWAPGPITLWAGWTPYFGGFWAQPTNQTVVAGRAAAFYVEASTYPPPTYQWYFNGAPIPGAVSSSYQIASVQPGHAGSYHVVLINPYWGIRSSTNATLTVLERPTITSGPQTQTAELGATAAFQVSASGTPPLGYQWLFNGTEALNGATDEVLRLTNAQFSQVGAYAVVVTNLAGSVTSTPAMLNVIAPVARRWVPGIILLGQPGIVFNLEVTDTLVPAPNWVAFDSVLLAEAALWYFDLTMPLPAQRYFRAWQTSGRTAPVLDAHLIPALTLTGPIGSKLRVDGINQFGPTDAWFPVAAVTLTNSSQLYFDVSVIDQPPRLYRLVQVP